MATRDVRETGDYHGYERLGAELRRRLRGPSRHPTYLIFFLASFLLFGAAAVWLEWIKWYFAIGGEAPSLQPLRTALATYFPAILGPVGLQLAISDTLRSLRALGYVLSFVFTMLALVLVLAGNLADGAAIAIGIAAVAFSLLAWWVVNADVPDLLDEPEPDAAVGGPDPTEPLAGREHLGDFNDD